MSTTAAAVLPADSGGSLGTILLLARKEIRDALRNRWFVLYTIAFAALALALSFVSTIGTGSTGLAGFGRTSASLIHLVILVVPLMALTAGAGALVTERERGTLSYLLAQPVTPLEVFTGKYLGLSIALLAALSLGFGTCAVALAVGGTGTDAGGFLRLVGLSFLMALAMLGFGSLLSVISRRSSLANGLAIFSWLGFVFLSDLGLMGSSVVFRMQITDLFHACLLHPLQVFKMASLASLQSSLDVLGPVGLYAQQAYGEHLDLLLMSVLAAWVVVPFALAATIFVRKGAS